VRTSSHTAESVTEGHPDKVADQVSDAVLDAMLTQDPESRVACETILTKGLCLVTGEVKSTADVDIESLVRETIVDIGYRGGDSCFDGRSCAVLVALGKQSPDIAMGVNASHDHEQGAGDQGMMFGYACGESPAHMPLPIYLAHRLTRALSRARKDKVLPWLQPDGKSQVSVTYEGRTPRHVDTVVLSAQHGAEIPIAVLRDALVESVIKPAIPEVYFQSGVKLHINPTGRFVLGGPAADSGLTGRKTMVDSYGSRVPHGGGAFSGKDGSKVDRSAAYMARYIAKNVVAAGLADECEVRLAYAIGIAEPVSVGLETFGTGRIDDGELCDFIRHHFDCRPANMIERLELKSPLFRHTAAYGHFGREDVQFPWERTDQADYMRQCLQS